MLRVPLSKKPAIVTDPSDAEILRFSQNSKNQLLVTTEVKRIVQALDFLCLPQLQPALVAFTATKIISQRLRYKSLISSTKEDKQPHYLPQFSFFNIYDPRALELKHIRQALEFLVNSILKNPQKHLRLDATAINTIVVAYKFLPEQYMREQQLLINIRGQVAPIRDLSQELLEINENFSWLHDQHAISKLSNLALLMIMHFKASFHKLIDRYSMNDSYQSRSAIVAEMEPLASFVASLEKGIKLAPKFYRHLDDNTVSSIAQPMPALIHFRLE
jgi:hypothetical protein